MNTSYNTVILITGPDAPSHQETLSLLTKKITNVITIGDGKTDITNNQVHETLASIKKHNPDFFIDKVLVYIAIHGATKAGEHYLFAKKDEFILSKDLFNSLQNSINQPMDIIFIPCYGKAALKAIDILPIGSRVMFFSDADKTTSTTNLLTTFNNAHDDKIFTFESFYDNYLAHLGKIEGPIIASPEANAIDPLALSKSYLGKSISANSREYVHKFFAANICSDAVCHQDIDLLMEKIENSQSITDFIEDSNLYAHALINIEYRITTDYPNAPNLMTYGNNTSKITSCPAWAPKSKLNIDKYLFDLNIPLELDLSVDGLFENNDDHSNIADHIKGFSNRGIHDILLTLLKSNDNFPIPDYQDFGKVLGIINAIHESESL